MKLLLSLFILTTAELNSRNTFFFCGLAAAAVHVNVFSGSFLLFCRSMRIEKKTIHGGMGWAFALQHGFIIIEWDYIKGWVIQQQ